MKIIEIDLSCEFVSHLTEEELTRAHQILSNSIKNPKKVLDDSKIDFDALKSYYNSVFTKSMRVVTEKTKTNINKRIKEGYLKSDIRKVIDNASNDKFHEPNEFKHVTLEFLSRADIFSRYVSEKEHQVPRNKKLLNQLGHINH